jgi:hypothetical protein
LLKRCGREAAAELTPVHLSLSCASLTRGNFSDSITTFHPEFLARNGRAYLEVTFPDGTLATLSRPEELDPAGDGVFPEAVAYIRFPSAWEWDYLVYEFNN